MNNLQQFQIWCNFTDLRDNAMMISRNIKHYAKPQKFQSEDIVTFALHCPYHSTILRISKRVMY